MIIETTIFIKRSNYKSFIDFKVSNIDDGIEKKLSNGSYYICI
jgi:hypothetical protein